MERIKSFQVDHTKLLPGLYVSRIDGDVTTFDLRFKKPNQGDLLSNVAMHTLEHMYATYLRNSELSDNIIYFGPMGCQTGFYLLTRGLDNKAVYELLLKTTKDILDYEGEVFGKSAKECGNYKSLDLNEGKKEAEKYLKVLSDLKDLSLAYEE